MSYVRGALSLLWLSFLLH